MNNDLDQYIENLMPFIKNELVEKQKKEYSPIAKRILNESNVSDKVDISTWDYNDWEIFHEMYKFEKEVPADLLFSKTLPIKDILIIEDSQKFRVTIMDDYAEKIDAIKENAKKPLIIGAIEYFTEGDRGSFRCVFAMVLLYGIDKIMLQYCGENEKEVLLQNFGVDPYHENSESLEKLISYGALSDWYFIQLSLLNPATKVLFSNPTIMRVPVKNKPGTGKQKRKCRYVKTYTIKGCDIKKHFHDSNNKINRKCLCWYVIGHWREYKTGQKIFIQGYWKGALKETKRNYDDGRERIIDAEVIRNASS